jgi:non-canonical (house-cleaning) NTP pyrophosphatase
MEITDFWQRLQRGVEVAVSGSNPDKLLGVRDGFLRYFKERLDRPVSIAVVSQSEAAPAEGLPVTDEQMIQLARSGARDLQSRLAEHYHFFVASEGGLDELRVGEDSSFVVRNWTVVLSPIGEAWGSSGSVQIPQRLITGLDRHQLPYAVPGTRRGGGMIASLTGGLESRRKAVELATVHALSTLFFGLLGGGTESSGRAVLIR